MKRLVIAVAAVLACHPVANAQEADFRRADSNGDGRVDISDAVFTSNWLFLGGPAPSSQDAVDTNDDGRTNIVDGIDTLLWLFRDGAPPPPPFPDAGPDPTPDGLGSTTYPSGEVVGRGSRLSFFGADSVAAEPGSPVRIPVEVRLEAHDSVQAWSFGILPSGGGGIASATTSGTVAADVSEDPPGVRTAGFETTRIVNSTQGAVSAVSLSLTDPVSLDPSGNPYTVLALTLEGIGPPAGMRQSWELTFSDGLGGTGQPVDTVVTVDGLSFVPSLSTYRVELLGVSEPFSLTLLSTAAVGLLAYAWRRKNYG